MHAVKKNEKVQYFGLFEDAGWSHVCSVGNSIHYFSALSGTKPIYTDKDTLSEKYKKGTRDVIKATLIAIIVFLVSILLSNYSGRLWKNKIISLILSMITGASIGPVIAFIITGIILKLRSRRFH